MNPIVDAEGGFQTAWTQVQQDWAELRSKWPDAVGDQFAKQFWERYSREVPKFLRAMTDLAEAYEQTDFAED